MNKKKPAVLFAECDGQLFVKAKAIMHWLIPFSDGLSVSTFKGDKNLYLKVEDAIDWCEREKKFHPGPMPKKAPKCTYDKMIDTMKKAKAEMEIVVNTETEALP